MSKILGTVVDIAIVGAVAFVGYEVIKCKTQHPNQSIIECIGLGLLDDIEGQVKKIANGIANEATDNAFTGTNTGGGSAKCKPGYRENPDAENVSNFSFCEFTNFGDTESCKQQGYLPLCYNQQDAILAGKKWN